MSKCHTVCRKAICVIRVSICYRNNNADKFVKLHVIVIFASSRWVYNAEPAYLERDVMHRIVIILTLLLLGTRLYAQTPLSLETIKEMRPSVVQGRIVADYSTIYYEELGQGEPLIFIHDHSLSCAMWESQFYALSGNFRMIRYDLRGYGESSPQPEFIHFTHAEDVITLMNALGIDKAHIIGLGMGGSVGVDLLAWHPERVLSAMLVSGNIEKIPGPSVPLPPAGASKRDLKTSKQKDTDKAKLRQKRLNELIKNAGSHREEIREAVSRMVEAWDVWQPFHKESRVLGGMDTAEILKEKRPDIRVWIVEGKLSKRTSSNRPEILDYLPTAQYKVMDNCGLLVNMEQPEAFNQFILECMLPAAEF